ncbi:MULTISPECIES: hypothetical protein [unclassified Lacinutrix]
MTEFKQWSFSVERRNRFARETMLGKTFEEYPTEEEDILEVDGVIFSIHGDEISEIKELPSFLNRLPNLKSVRLPIDWLSKIDIPTSIEELILTKQVYSKQNIEKWSENLKFNTLKHLSVPELLHPYEINLRELTSLESIEYDFTVEKKNEKLLAIAELPNLKELTINYGKKWDLFTPLENSNIENLRLLGCTGKKIALENIVKVKKLKKLELVYYRLELDCNLFLELKNLESLELVDNNKIINIEALLKHKNLKHLSVSSCKKPFSEKDKELFLSHGFESLDIDYA